MAGKIKRSDIDEVRQCVSIDTVVGEYVSLKRAGVDSLKGLCPFHDEKSPSFHVRPSSGYFHCFGCGEGGDSFAFLQKIDHLGFQEAVEKLAASIGYQLTYEDGSIDSGVSERSRIIEANKAAEAFFFESLQTPEAQVARDFLTGRGFDRAACEMFRVGFAPKSFDALKNHLASLRFTEAEMEAAGLVSRGDRGVYDRFRGRAIWPIRDVTGVTLGFGARRLLDDDNGPKYLNTAETAVYHKAKVLYGIDLAKRSISRDRRVVVVEGYTDVMACHLAGITTAVATCGTAFGSDHVSLIRRILGDVEAGDSKSRGEVIFTFDPDEAGQKAASKAFAEDSKFAANTFVAVAPAGLDPADLWQQRGADALNAVIETKKPLFEFIIRRTIEGFDLETVEGRVQATRAVAPVLHTIKDKSLVDGYVRIVAAWIGVDQADLRGAMAGRTLRVEVETGSTGSGFAELSQNPTTRLDRDALSVIMQYPNLVGIELAGQVLAAKMSHPALNAVRTAMVDGFTAFGTNGWISTVTDGLTPEYQPLVAELAIAPIPVKPVKLKVPVRDTEETAAARRAQEQELTRIEIETYVKHIASAAVEQEMTRQRDELLTRLGRLTESDPEFADTQRALVDIEQRKRAIRNGLDET